MALHQLDIVFLQIDFLNCIFYLAKVKKSRQICIFKKEAILLKEIFTFALIGQQNHNYFNTEQQINLDMVSLSSKYSIVVCLYLLQDQRKTLFPKR